MKREDVLTKIKREALRLEPSPLLAPVRTDFLLKYDGDQFVDILYRKILKREPDIEGKAHYSRLVGRIPKPFMIYLFSKSEEARQKGTEIIRFYSASMRYYLKTPSASVNVLLPIIKRAFARLKSLPSFPKAARDGKIDYFRFRLDLEEELRGPEERVEEDLRIYLPLLEGVDDLIIDLGSGRGEWLRLLKREGFDAKGVEKNPYLVEKCYEEALEVVKSDALKFLKNARTSSVGAFTAFHLIEHLGPQQRLLFLKEIHRVLRRGGLLILETPNPRNILVGTGDFWRDPEHTTTVFPDTLSFMTEFVGFSDVTCYFLNDSKTELIPSLNVDFRDLNDHVEVSKDFALFARKP